MKVTILSKDKCIEIAKIMGHENKSEESLLLYLPDRIFGTTQSVEYISKDVHIRESGDCLLWSIPAYFIGEIDKY